MLIQWRALGRGKIAEGSLKRAFERWFKMRTYLRRAFRSGGLMEKRFWKRAYFWRVTNMHLYIGAFIDAMELS